MKKNLFFFFALALCASISMTSCGTSDPCKDVDCGQSLATPQGACLEGECVCNEGYDGTACADEFSAKFLGNYGGTDNFTSSDGSVTGPYTLPAGEPVKIEKASANEVNIIALGNYVSTSFKVPVTRDASSQGTIIKVTDVLGYAAASTTKLTMDAIMDKDAKTLKGTYTITFPDASTTTSTFSYLR